MARIAIVLATYNGARYLPQMLDSLVSQERRANIVFAIDDGSCDSTPEILRNYTSKLPIRLEALPHNTGHRAAFSTALEIARKELSPDDLIALADQDDIWLPQKLRLLENAIENDLQKATLILGDAEVIDGEGKLIYPSWRKVAHIATDEPFKTRIAGTNNVTGCLSLFRASLLDKILPIPEAVGVHDAWIGLLAAKHGGISTIDTPVIQYRLHDSNAVGLGNRYTFDETCKRQIAWSALICENADPLGLTPDEKRFARALHRYWEKRARYPFLPCSLAFLARNRAFLFPQKDGRLKKVLFSTLGAPAVHLLFGKDK